MRLRDEGLAASNISTFWVNGKSLGSPSSIATEAPARSAAASLSPAQRIRRGFVTLRLRVESIETGATPSATSLAPRSIHAVQDIRDRLRKRRPTQNDSHQRIPAAGPAAPA